MDWARSQMTRVLILQTYFNCSIILQSIISYEAKFIEYFTPGESSKLEFGNRHGS
jgi:hypothetical protein